MILHQIQIHCAAEATPDNIQHYSWNEGDNPAYLQAIIKALIDHNGQIVSPKAIETALTPDNNVPIEPFKPHEKI